MKLFHWISDANSNHEWKQCSVQQGVVTIDGQRIQGLVVPRRINGKCQFQAPDPEEVKAYRDGLDW